MTPADDPDVSLAERTREAVRERPFLYDALAAGVVSYTAAARFLDVGDTEAVAAALRRYADDRSREDPAGDARVTMESGSGLGEDESGDPGADTAEAILTVGDTAQVPGAGSLTAVLATGEASPATLEEVLGRCRSADLSVEAASVADDTLAVVVGRRDGPDALRLVEDAV